MGMAVVDTVACVGDGETVIAAIVTKRREVPAMSGLCAVGGVAGVRAESGAAHRRGLTATATSMSSWVAPVRRSTRTTTPERPGLPLRRSARTFCREHGSHRPRVLERGIYDPTTGQFITRDPLNSRTRSAYGYVGNNPLNGSDPTGLYWGEDTVNSIADNLVPDQLAQGAADLAGGTLNGLTLGHADMFIDESKVNWDSGVTKVGSIAGVGLLVPLVVPSVFGTASTATGLAMVGGARAALGLSYGLYDIKQTGDYCNTPGHNPQTCSDRLLGAYVGAAVFGAFGLTGWPIVGWAALGWGGYKCFQKFVDR